MVRLSKGNSIWSLVVNGGLVQPQKYCEDFIFPLKNHMQITEAGVQNIEICSATGRLEEDASTLVSMRSIDIPPINRDILKEFKGRKRKGNNHMVSGVGNKRQPLSFQ